MKKEFSPAEWDARSEEHDKRFREHFPESDDLLAIVLRGHLLVEECLDTLNCHCFHNPEYYTKARLSFAKKILIAQAQVLIPHRDPSLFFGVIEKLNELRNNLAHNLGSERLQSKIHAFLNKAERLMPKHGDPDVAEEIREYYTPEYIETMSTEKRVSRAICYLLGQLSVMDLVVGFMESCREYGPPKDEPAGIVNDEAAPHRD